MTSASAGAESVMDWCKKNFEDSYSTLASCIEAEEAAKLRLESRPVDLDVMTQCRQAEEGRPAGLSYVAFEECVRGEVDLRHTRAANPYGLRNSKTWYAPSLRRHFPSYMRICGVDKPVELFSILPVDITSFTVATQVKYEGQLPALLVEGSLRILEFPREFEISVGGERPGESESGKGEYLLYLEAFLITPDGRVADIRSIEPVKDSARVDSSGANVSFSFEVGRGYDFKRGGTLIVVASGDPIDTGYPVESCTAIGAKTIRLK